MKVFQIIRTYINILRFAILQEKPSEIFRNVLRLFQKTNPYKIVSHNSLTFQFTHIYQTPSSIEVKGWIYHPTNKNIDVYLAGLEKKFTTGIRDVALMNKMKFSHPNLGIYLFDKFESSNPKRLHVSIKVDGEKTYHFPFNLPVLSSQIAKPGINKILGPIYCPVKNTPPITTSCSIIIPFKNQLRLLSSCLNSISASTMLGRLEIILADNSSTDPEVKEYVRDLVEERGFKYLLCDYGFNYSKMINEASKLCSNEFLIFLNNDIEIISSNWLNELLRIISDDTVGVCGPKLLYPDNTIQHIGLVIPNFIPMHAFKHYPNDPKISVLHESREYFAISGACMAIKKSKFWDVGGFDERLGVTLNDVDLCLKLRSRNLKVVSQPLVTMIHHESKTRGIHDTLVNSPRSENEKKYFIAKWKDVLSAGDPFFNKDLSIKYPDFRRSN